jgi:hypothetical protein
MIIVNFFAGPGAGKSTAAAETFALLKQAGVKVELVTEFAKDLTWDRSVGLGWQPYVFGEQSWRVERLRGQADVVVTDSPVLLQLVYGEALPEAFYDLVRWQHFKDRSVNIRLIRTKPYAQYGRAQTEARELDWHIHTMLDCEGVDYLTTTKGPQVAFQETMRALMASPGAEQPHIP